MSIPVEFLILAKLPFNIIPLRVSEDGSPPSEIKFMVAHIFIKVNPRDGMQN